MRRIVVIALGALAASGCNAEPYAASNDTKPAHAAAPANAPAPEGKPVALKSETPLLSWEASWPAEVNAIPALERLIREPAEKALADYTRDAREEKARRDKEGFDFNGYMYAVAVEVAGQTPRLLSLTRGWSSYAGGAHLNHGTEALLWDKPANALVPLDRLLSGRSLESLYRESFCKGLDAERAKKREGVEMTLDSFTECPKFDEIQIIPKGPAAGGPMTALLFHADPYIAGPYVEGDYDVELPVSAAFIAALKPDYRSSFATSR